MMMLGTPNIEKLKSKNNISRLIQALEHKNPEIREDAIKALAELGSTEAVQPLVAMLQDESVNIREAAALALGRIGDASAQMPLIKLLDDTHRNVRRTAVLALGKVGDVHAVPYLIAALQQWDGQECETGFDTLAQIGKRIPAANRHPALAKPLLLAFKDELPSGNEVILENMGWERGTDNVNPGIIHKHEAVITLLETLQWQPVPDETATIYWMLKDQWDLCAEAGDAAVAPLIQVLRDRIEDPFTQQKAAGALAKIGSPAVAPLLTMLHEQDHKLQDAACGILAAIGRPAIEPLMQVFQQDDANVRRAVVKVLGRIGGAHAVSSLLVALADTNWSVRRDAAVALEDLKMTLFCMLNERDEHTRQQAIAALEAIEWQPEPNEAGAAYCIAKRDWGQCVMLGAVATGPLIVALHDNEHTVQKAAAWALGQVGDTHAISPLIETLRHWGVDEDATMATAFVGIGKRMERESVEGQLVKPLVVAFNDNAKIMRGVVGKVMKEVGWQPAATEVPVAVVEVPEVPALIEALAYPDATDRAAATDRLLEIGAPAVQPLVDAIRGADQDVQKTIVAILCKIGPTSVKPLILALKDDEPDMRGAAAAALGTIGDVQALKPLTFVLKDENERVRRAVVWSLRRLAPTALTETDQHIHKAAAWVLGRIGTVQAVSPLIDALKRCEDEDEQTELITALVQLGGRLDSVTLKCDLVEPLIDAFMDVSGSRYNAAMTVLNRLGWQP